MCRCGVERTQLEALGYSLDLAPESDATSARAAAQAVPGLAGTVLGFRSDEDVDRGWRLGLKTVFVAVIALVGAVTVRFTHGDLPPTRENVRIVSTLEAYTQNAGAHAANTIPGFLSSAGTIGILESSMAPTDLLKGVDEAALRQAFCSQSIAKQIRYQYPGFYDAWPDDKLEVTVLERYPEYRDRLCVLSSQIDAGPDEIVKYELKTRTLLGHAGLWLRTMLVTAVFAIACMNLYYRLLVNRLPSA